MPRKRKIVVKNLMPKPKPKTSLFGTAKPSNTGKITKGINTRSALPPEMGSKRRRKKR